MKQSGRQHTAEPTDQLPVSLVTDAGWHRLGEADGTPLWQWQQDHTIRVLTYDHDVLRIIAAALNYHDHTATPPNHTPSSPSTYSADDQECPATKTDPHATQTTAIATPTAPQIGAYGMYRRRPRR